MNRACMTAALLTDPVYRRRPDGVVTLCDPSAAGPDSVLIVCQRGEPTDREWHEATVSLMLKRRMQRERAKVSP